jgi:uncharacterized protein
VTRTDLPWPVVFVPLLALLLLPLVAHGELGRRLAVLGAELLLGLPALWLTPRELRPAVLPLRTWPAGGRLWLLLPALALAYQLAAIALGSLAPLPPEAEEALRRALNPSGTVPWLLAATGAILLAPLMEEIYFRGVLPWIWRHQVGGRGVLTGPALAFALLHGNPWQLPQLFLLGLLLGFVRERTGSLLPGIVLHLLINVIGLTMLRLGF